jgi:pre-rRNA-processing protein TSR3
VQHVESLSFIVIRHRKENRKKCSLRGLEGRSDILFFEYPSCMNLLPSLEQTILLDMDAEPLSSDDRGPFVLLDGTWRYASIMKKQIPQLNFCRRRKIPDGWHTAYPRKQSEWVDPERGLATVEAIYVAGSITNTPMEGILDHYYWKEDFLKRNC